MTTDQVRLNSEMNNETPIAAFLALMFRYWLLILVVTLMALGGGIALAIIATPIYRAEAVLAYSAPESNESAGLLGASGLGGIANLAGLSLGSSRNREEAIAVLQSLSLARTFIEDQDLLTELYPGASSSVDTVGEEPPTINDAVRLFNREVRSVIESDRGLILLRIEWRDPAVVAAWANGLVRLANERLRSEAIAEATESIEYLEDALERSSLVGVNQAIYGLIESQIQRVMLANVREHYAFRPIDSAIVPESDQYVRPNPPFIILAAMISGLMIGILIAFFFGVLREARQKK